MPKVTTRKTKKSPAKKPQTAKKTVKMAVKKVATKKPVKKVVAKKTVAKKPVVKKTTAKKQPVKKVAPKKVTKNTEKPIIKAPHNRAQALRKKALDQTPVVTAKEKKNLFKVGNYVVYPTHGVGKILAEETQMIGDVELRLLVINFEKDKMTLRVPMQRATAAGLRPISGNDRMKEVYKSLKSKAKTSRGMWSRRAQEYEAKINSGNIILISEVVRDLHQNVDQSERSYSERMIYENALNRLVAEVAAAEATDSKAAYDKLMKLLRAKVAAALKEAA